MYILAAIANMHTSGMTRERNLKVNIILVNKRMHLSLSVVSKLNVCLLHDVRLMKFWSCPQHVRALNHKASKL